MLYNKLIFIYLSKLKIQSILMNKTSHKKLFDDTDSQNQQSQQIVQLSINKNPTNKPKIQTPLPKTKKIQKKQSKPSINPQLRKMLQQKIQDQKVLKQLQKGPLNFGNEQNKNNKKILLIEQKIKQQRKQTRTGINLVFQKKALPRKGTNRLSNIISKCNNLRGNMDVIQRAKK